MAEKHRVVIANRADGGVLYWLVKLYAFTLLLLCYVVGVTAFVTYQYFAEESPRPPDVKSYAEDAPTVTRMYAHDGTLLGEFAKEWREIAAYEDIPEKLVQAFLAVEDHDYFRHSGIYLRGIARAAWTNLVAGDFAQGGSTITQQVAKQFLSSEKSLTRKAKEAILARRLEARYSKKAILSLYLNQIYLGAGAYGVKAAAKRYFGKSLAELTVAEMALIAGLAQAPSRYSPLRDPERAKARRDLVLSSMGKHGYLTPEEVETWQGEAIALLPYTDIFPERLPYYAEHVRRQVIETHGLDALMAGGLTIETAADPVVYAAAAENVAFGTHKQDKRQGWRGAEWFLEGQAAQTFIERAEALYGDGPLDEERRYLGLVEEVSGRGAKVRVGKGSYDLPLENMSWAAPWSRTEAHNDNTIFSATQALKVGDVIWVMPEPSGRERFRDWTLENTNPRWLPRDRRDEPGNKAQRLLLDQVPHPQGAILTADHSTGYVLAPVGGYDFSRSEYNRATQACRQPASTYKPIYYSAALAEGYGYDTILNDVPRAEVDPLTGEIWTPTNLGGTVDNQVTLEYALVFSKNVPSVALFKMVGAEKVEAWARKLGFTTTIIADQALALGASCTKLDELTRAFAIFARNGRWIDWVYVRRIRDRSGNIIEDNTVYYDPALTASDRLDRLYTTAGHKAKQAIPARAAYLITRLLEEVIQHGFCAPIRATDMKAAGKTGTSSDTMDTLFVAFTSRWITSVWLGDDLRVRPLGLRDAAYMTVVPLWARYMYEVASEHPNREIPWEIPEGLSARDRGDHSKGERGAQMPLIYRHAAKPEDFLDLGLPPEG